MPTEANTLRYALAPGEGLELLWQRTLAGDATAHACHAALIPLVTRMAAERTSIDEVERLRAENERLAKGYLKLLDRVDHLELMLDEALEARRAA